MKTQETERSFCIWQRSRSALVPSEFWWTRNCKGSQSSENYLMNHCPNCKKEVITSEISENQFLEEIKKRCAEEIQRWVDKSPELTFEQKSVLLIAKQAILNMRIE